MKKLLCSFALLSTTYSIFTQSNITGSTITRDVGPHTLAFKVPFYEEDYIVWIRKQQNVAPHFL